MSHPEGARVGGIRVDIQPREGLRLCRANRKPSVERRTVLLHVALTGEPTAVHANCSMVARKYTWSHYGASTLGPTMEVALCPDYFSPNGKVKCGLGMRLQ